MIAAATLIQPLSDALGLPRETFDTQADALRATGLLTRDRR